MLLTLADYPSNRSHTDLKADVFETIGYTPHPAQAAFHACDKRFRVLTAGARFGKSLAAAHDILPFMLKANTRGWIVGPSYRLAEKEFRYLLAALKKLGILELCKVRNGGTTGPSWVITPWGAEAHTLTAKNPDNLLGEELDWLIASETARFKPDVWEHYLHMRLASRAGIAVFPSTPKGFNEYFRMFGHGTNPDIDEWVSFQHASRENPHLPAHVLEHAKRTMPKAFWQEQSEGMFVDISGKIFANFKQSIHVTDDLIHQHGVEQWQLVGAMDFGHTNPTHVLAVRVSRSGRVAVVGEYHAAREGTDAMAQNMHRMGLGGCYIYCDPANRQLINDYALRGFITTGPRARVTEGLQYIDDHLRIRSDGLPGLLIDSRCRELIDQLEKYTWQETRGPDNEPRPRKEHDHGVDALRYLLVGLAQMPHLRINDSQTFANPESPSDRSSESGAVEGRAASAAPDSSSSAQPSAPASFPEPAWVPRPLSWQSMQQLPPNNSLPDYPDGNYWHAYRVLQEKEEAFERRMRERNEQERAARDRDARERARGSALGHLLPSGP